MGKHCGVFSGENCNVRDEDFFSFGLNTFRQPFVTKFGVVVHHHEPECDAKKSKYDGAISVIVN